MKEAKKQSNKKQREILKEEEKGRKEREEICRKKYSKQRGETKSDESQGGVTGM